MHYTCGLLDGNQCCRPRLSVAHRFSKPLVASLRGLTFAPRAPTQGVHDTAHGSQGLVVTCNANLVSQFALQQQTCDTPGLHVSVAGASCQTFQSNWQRCHGPHFADDTARGRLLAYTARVNILGIHSEPRQLRLLRIFLVLASAHCLAAIQHQATFLPDCKSTLAPK